MHELTVAIGIVEIAEKEAKKANISKLTKIELEIGTLSGVEIEALNFAWPMAVMDTILENVEKKIQTVQAKAKCMDCNVSFEINNLFDHCPACKGYSKSILQGKELRVKSIEF